jgi:hypothetical protein
VERAGQDLYAHERFFFCLGAAGSPLKCKAMLTNLFLTLAAAEFIRIVI